MNQSLLISRGGDWGLSAFSFFYFESSYISSFMTSSVSWSTNFQNYPRKIDLRRTGMVHIGTRKSKAG
jgi:hypothetical protein